jgi:hypothetical protein
MSELTFDFYPSGEDVLDKMEELAQLELEHLEKTKANTDGYIQCEETDVQIVST